VSGAFAGSLLLAALLAAAPQEPSELRPRLAIEDPSLRAAVRRAFRAVSDRLQDPACLRVLDDFAASDGSSLRSVLAAAGRSPTEHLALILFTDSELRACQADARRLALTMPGARVIFVCPAFRTEDSAWAQAVLIHEFLHTLGLGENPPPEREITMRVITRCLPQARWR
jgi:hypothetical protein